MHELSIKRSAQKQLAALPRVMQQRIIEHLCKLRDHPHPQNSKKLVGYDDLYRLHIGDCRAVYQLDGESILVAWIGHRRDAYR